MLYLREGLRFGLGLRFFGFGDGDDDATLLSGHCACVASRPIMSRCLGHLSVSLSAKVSVSLSVSVSASVSVGLTLKSVCVGWQQVKLKLPHNQLITAPPISRCRMCWRALSLGRSFRPVQAFWPSEVETQNPVSCTFALNAAGLMFLKLKPIPHLSVSWPAERRLSLG